MKKLLASVLIAAHVLTLVPLPAHAAYPNKDAVAYQETRVAKARRVMLVKPSRWKAIAAAHIEWAVVANGVYQVVDMLREQGCEVHEYNSDVFTSSTFGNSALWRNAGDQYALAIVLQPGTMEAGQERFVNADSTNVQILAVGGVRSNGAAQWVADTTRRGMLDTATRLESTSSTKFSCLVPLTSSGLGTDTLWGKNLTSGRLLIDNPDTAGIFNAVHTNIVRVVRMLQPVVAGNPGSSWATAVSSAADSTSTRMPGAAWATPGLAGSEASALDSVARSGEYLGPLWRVEYSNGRSTWFFKFASTASADVHNPIVLWGAVCRFVDAAPIKWALDWDDVFDVNDSDNYPRWRNSAAESALAALRRVGVVPSNGINPTNAPGYIGGFTPLGESGTYNSAVTDSVPWVGDAHTFARKLNWITHAHDSSNAYIGSNLVGGYGGYAPSNGPIAFGSGQTGRRFASRYDPTANGSNFIGAGARYGIVQRLAYDDSVRKAWSPGSRRPPYLTFPANQMLPINWRGGRGTVAGYTPTNVFAVNTTNADSLCTIDSLLWALDYGLLGQQTTGKGEIWLRSGLITGPRIEALWADRDSFVAQTFTVYPRGRWFTVHISGRKIQAEVLHSFNQGINTRAGYIDVSGYRAGTLLGLNNRVNKAEMHYAIFGDTYNTDANKQMNFLGFGGLVNFPARQSTRILYLHPGQQTVSPAQTAPFTPNGVANNSSGDQHVEIFLRGIHSNIRIADAIAGRKASICVPAWQVYAKK